MVYQLTLSRNDQSKKTKRASVQLLSDGTWVGPIKTPNGLKHRSMCSTMWLVKRVWGILRAAGPNMIPTWDVWNPINDGIFTISPGEGSRDFPALVSFKSESPRLWWACRRERPFYRTGGANHVGDVEMEPQFAHCPKTNISGRHRFPMIHSF